MSKYGVDRSLFRFPLAFLWYSFSLSDIENLSA